MNTYKTPHLRTTYALPSRTFRVMTENGKWTNVYAQKGQNGEWRLEVIRANGREVIGLVFKDGRKFTTDYFILGTYKTLTDAATALVELFDGR